MNRLLTVKDTCQLLSVSKPTLYKMVHENQIPYLKIRGQIRFDEDKLENWVKSVVNHDYPNVRMAIDKG